MPKSQQRMSLFDAARRAGVTFKEEVLPESKAVEANGLRFHYLDWGNPHLPAMILVHGGLQTAHSWDFFALAIRDRYHVVVPDRRGHGDSDWSPTGDYSQEANLQDLEELARVLGLNRFVLIGLSMGGRDCYRYAAAHPDQVTALVIVDVGPEMNIGGVRRMSGSITQQAIFDSLEEAARRAHQYDPNRPLEQFMSSIRNNLKQLPDGKWTWKYDRRFLESGGADYTDPDKVAGEWEALKQLRCPTLLVRGGVSRVFTLEVAERMVAAIPDCTLVQVPRAGHLVTGDNPAGFQQVVGDFLEKMNR